MGKADETPRKPAPPSIAGATGAEGGVRYHLLGEERGAKNAKDAYIAVFTTLAKRDREFLIRLAPKLRGRKNRRVARTKQELSSAEVMVNSAVLLPDDWWLLTHLSNKDKIQALRIACEVAGIPFGERNGLQIVLPNA